MGVRINEMFFNAEYMATPEEISRGMMGRKSLDGCMVLIWVRVTIVFG